MALFKSQIVTQASGSIGGTTFSRSPSGMYMRSRAVPTNPNTTLQGSVRDAMQVLSTRWSETLSDAQREAWDLYAANVALQNPLGSAFFQSGQNAYIQSNLTRLAVQDPVYTPLDGIPIPAAAQPPRDDAPTIFDRGSLPGFALASITAGVASVSFIDTEDWCSEDESLLFVWISRPRNEGRKFFNGPWRLLGVIAGDSVSSPTSPQSLNVVAPTYIPAGSQLARIRGAVSRVDGRYSAPVQSEDVQISP